MIFLFAITFASSGAFADVPEHPNLLIQQKSLWADNNLWAQQSSAASTDMEEEDEEDYEEDDEYYDDDEYEDEEEVELIPDPLVEFNYGMWVFNDKLYFWVLKPVSTVYKIVPVELRTSIKNIFYSQI